MGAFYADLVLFIIDDMSWASRIIIVAREILGDYSSFFHLRAIHLQPMINEYTKPIISVEEDSKGKAMKLAMIRFQPTFIPGAQGGGRFSMSCLVGRKLIIFFMIDGFGMGD